MSKDHDACVDDVRHPRCAQELPGLASLNFCKFTNCAPRQQARKLRLRSASPSLSKNGRWHGGTDTLIKNSPMDCPHQPLAPLRSNQCARVVKVPAHDARRRCLRFKNLSAWASSPSVNAPCSASHSATARKPASTARACSAASFNQADRLDRDVQQRTRRQSPSCFRVQQRVSVPTCTHGNTGLLPPANGRPSWRLSRRPSLRRSHRPEQSMKGNNTGHRKNSMTSLETSNPNAAAVSMRSKTKLARDAVAFNLAELRRHRQPPSRACRAA